MATITRADALTANKKQLEFYSDFLDNFNKTPIGNQLGRIVNEKSVSQSIKNLLMTNLGERLYQPTIGSSINRSLFEPNADSYLTVLEYNVRLTIQNNEPRAVLQDINIASIGDYTIQINITYTLINSTE